MKKAIVAITLVFVLGAMFMSLFQISGGGEFKESTTSCPFMAHEEVVCQMNFADYIEAWKSAFQVLLPAFSSFLVVVGSVVYIAYVACSAVLPSRKLIPILYRQLRERTYLYTYRSLQEFFSRGILHPKLF
ncbi:MAG: hypothetical protein ACK42D_01390 [Candidatus Paceibacteria bacterium]